MDNLGQPLDPSIEEPAAKAPADPDYREGVNVWIWDDAGRICFPRMGIESVGRNWETGRTVMINLARPDGRILSAWGDHPPHPIRNAEEQPRIIGAGPMRFECIEPFSHWRMAFDGLLEETTLADQIAGRGPAAVGPARRRTGDVPVTFDFDLHSVTRPWTQSGEGRPQGEKRFEQLFRATGTVRIGDEESPFSGGGVRIRRKGGNRTPHGNFFGHVWHTAFFPSGRAFGLNHRYLGPDSAPRFADAWLMEDGEVLHAEVLDRPWLQNAQVHDDKFSFVLRTAKGDTRIEARSYASTFAVEALTGESASFPSLQQGIAQYRWGSEEAFGMVERSRRLGWAD